MPYSISLYFDSTTEALIRSLWKELAAMGAGPYLYSDNRPRFTLAIYGSLDAEQARSRLAEIAAEQALMPVSFQYIGCFPGSLSSIFLGPTVTEDLLGLHRLIYQRFEGIGTSPGFDLYFPGRWIPHCGLATDMESGVVPKAIAVVQNRLMLPLNGQIEEIGVIELRPVKHLFGYRFEK